MNYFFISFKQKLEELAPATAQKNINVDILEKVNIYNTLGQIIKTESNTTIDVSKLQKGTYFVEVITNQGKATKSIIVN